MYASYRDGGDAGVEGEQVRPDGLGETGLIG
ncbi:MAG: hypothetical protein BWX48_00553 [Verrucomicrobia bacterium ADurb.Bin006]|jgi:hypothetical protein|nr:MAG: hypothetical protein BWX48_00553 [Verrucomicrobia bacterium ADurb.Bin006]